MNVPGKNVSTTSGRVSRTIRTSCSSAAPCCQFASDTSTSCPAVSFPSRNHTFVIPRVAFARRASISRIAASPDACSVPTSFPPLPPRVPYTTATRLPSSIARARYAVAAPSSSGCATTNKMSALYRASGSRSFVTTGAFPSGAPCSRAPPTLPNPAPIATTPSPPSQPCLILVTITNFDSPISPPHRLKRKSVPRPHKIPSTRTLLLGAPPSSFEGGGLDDTKPILSRRSRSVPGNSASLSLPRHFFASLLRLSIRPAILPRNAPPPRRPYHPLSTRRGPTKTPRPHSRPTRPPSHLRRQARPNLRALSPL